METCSNYVAGNAMCNAMCNEHAGGHLLFGALPGLVRWAALGLPSASVLLGRGCAGETSGVDRAGRSCEDFYCLALCHVLCYLAWS